MSKFNRFYVYMHRFKNKAVYIGKGTRNRAYQISPGRHNTYWDRLLAKYGRPCIRIIARDLSEDDSLRIEMLVISRMKAKGRSMCNLTEGGNGCLGMNVSEETRRLISKKTKGKANGMYGVRHTDETKEKIRKAIAKYDRKGKSSPRYNTKEHCFVNRDGRSFKGTAAEFSVMSGCSRSHASLLCSGKSDSAKGWRLKGTPEEETGRKGRRHGRYDSRFFSFYHHEHGKVCCTKYDLREKYPELKGGNLSTLCSGKLKSYKGWTVDLSVEVNYN